MEVPFRSIRPSRNLSSYTLSVNGSSSYTAKPGDTLKVEFTTNETITSPTIKLAGHEVTANGSGTGWLPNRLSNTDTEGLVEVELTLTDLEILEPLVIPENANLIAYYSFDGNANDESTENNYGLVYGAFLSKDRFGKQNQAYEFNGINDYVQLAKALPIGC